MDCESIGYMVANIAKMRSQVSTFCFIVTPLSLEDSNEVHVPRENLVDIIKNNSLKVYVISHKSYLCISWQCKLLSVWFLGTMKSRTPHFLRHPAFFLLA